MASDSPHGDQVRTAEVVASLCLATDLGMGFPWEHGLRATLMASRMCGLLGVDAETTRGTYYASLVTYAGCTTDAFEAVSIFGGSMTEHVIPAVWGTRRERALGVLRAIPDPQAPLPTRVGQTARRLPRAVQGNRPHLAALCEVAQMLAERLGLPSSVHGMLFHLTDRWDGTGELGRARGEQIPLPLRISTVARDVALQRLIGGDEHALRLVSDRAGTAFDPEVTGVLLQKAPDVFAAADVSGSAWDSVLAAEPRPRLTMDGPEVDAALAAMGDFADLISPWLSGHSRAVSELAARAAQLTGSPDAEVTRLRRAGLVADIGRVAVDAHVFASTGPLVADQWEQVRLHPYHSERVLSRSPVLRPLAHLAGSHHERLDGSGYYRGVGAAGLAGSARMLAVADAFRGMTEPRPYRLALPPSRAASLLTAEARAGTLDADVVAAVLAAAEQPVSRIPRPHGLTRREIEVLVLLAHGLPTKQIARALGITAKTADHHVQNAYRKIGVSSRAAATLYAMEHGLLS